MADYDDVLVSLTAEVASVCFDPDFPGTVGGRQRNVKIQEIPLNLQTCSTPTGGDSTGLSAGQEPSPETQALVPTLEAGLRRLKMLSVFCLPYLQEI
jgi:hypothetical protein